MNTVLNHHDFFLRITHKKFKYAGNIKRKNKKINNGKKEKE
jgi:hypothetical protein